MVQKKGYNPPYINEFSGALLDKFYLKDGQIFDDALARTAVAYSFGDNELAQRIYDAAWNGWFMFASPVLSNSPEGRWITSPTESEWQMANENPKTVKLTSFFDGEEGRALPISCFGLVIPDSLDGQIEAMQEIALLSTAGGGVGAHNKIRATSNKAPGPIPFEKVLDSEMGYFKQSSVRRGALVYYLDINHPDIVEHISFRNPTGGDRKRRSDNLQGFHSGVNVTDEFIQAVEEDADFNLVCPHSGEVRETIRARELFEHLMDTRGKTGEPYITKLDTANRALPQSQKDLGLQINSSNLCVSGDTTILTKDGDLSIASLVDQEVEVWNGHGWSTVTVRQTGSGQSLIRVALTEVDSDTLTYIDCTPEHHFYLENGTRIEAQELAYGDLLEGWSNPDGVSMRGQMVLSIEPVDGLHNTYCFTEPIRHRGVFNGVLTGQCNEIYLPTSNERTFVCCLSSLNLEKYDEWKDTTLVADLTTFLDNVIQWFIEKADGVLDKASFSAWRERAIGIGAMGWHRYLQSKNIPWESGGFNSAVQHTSMIFKDIKQQAVDQSFKLGAARGESPDMIGTGRRNSHLLAVAPNSNSGILLGTSPSIEPEYGMVHAQTTRAGTHVITNPYIEKVVRDYAEENGLSERWVGDIFLDILHNEGSVQHLDFLSDEQKAVFKTAFEIDQHWVIEQAEERQKHICQGQSLNLFFPGGVPQDYVDSVHWKALKAEHIKGLYYFRTKRTSSSAVNERQKTIQTLKDWQPGEDDECLACQG